MLSDGSRSRWGFIDWQAVAPVLRAGSWTMFFGEMLLAGLWLYPRRAKRIALWGVIVLHAVLEVLLVDQLWNLTMAMMAFYLLRAPPAPPLGVVARGVFTVVALLQLQLAIPVRFHSVGVASWLNAVPGKQVWWLRGFQLHTHLSLSRYTCPAIVGEKNGRAQLIYGPSIDDCGDPPRFRLWAGEEVAVARLFLRHDRLDATLRRLCRDGWERVNAVVRTAPQQGGEERLQVWECGDCATMKLCPDAPDRWAGRVAPALTGPSLW